MQQMLQQLQNRLGDLTKPMTSIGEYLLTVTDQRFETETDPDGVPWKPLSPYTLRLKRELGLLPNILQATGAMKRSITYAADLDSVRVGTDVSYAPKHQFGLEGLPQRAFLGVSEADEAVILGILEEYILAANPG